MPKPKSVAPKTAKPVNTAKTRKTILPAPPPEGSVHQIDPSLLSFAVRLSEIKPDPANERTHSRQNLDAIRSSLVRYGQREPIVVNRRTGMIEAGHGRFLVMNELGWTHVAAVLVDEDQKSASGYRVVANRSAELADWDDEKLLATLRELGDAALPEVGFTSADLKRITDLVEPSEPEEKSVKPTFGAEIECPKCHHKWAEKKS